jgi:hypothetical protein
LSRQSQSQAMETTYRQLRAHNTLAKHEERRVYVCFTSFSRPFSPRSMPAVLLLKVHNRSRIRLLNLPFRHPTGTENS